MSNKKYILITGGTGLVGKKLQQQLLSKGYGVKILSSNKKKCDNNTVFYWDITTKTIGENSVENVDYIIHLAGANIADGKWTTKQKQLIIDSRTITTQLLYETLKKRNHQLKAFISASATGYYGAITTATIFNEGNSAANDFLGVTCKKWEESVNEFSSIGIRTVILRTGIVLSKNGGAIKKLLRLAELGLAAALGSGKQYFPWIHIDDLCNMYVKVIEDENISGVYNAVAPQHITNFEFTKALTRSVKKPFFMPNIPTFAIKLLLGEMAIILLEGSRVSAEKIIQTGFKFNYENIDKALLAIVSEK